MFARKKQKQRSKKTELPIVDTMTCEQVEAFIKDEQEASEEYDKLGLHSLAEDERFHLEVMKANLEEMKKKGICK